MKRISVLSIASLVCLSACGESEPQATSPEQLFDDCIAVFERKGGPAELGQQMCESMKQACEDDVNSEACVKAQRMVEKG
ncbi:MAG: hypothetical protein AAF660_15540 [Pseudomonadota bacterium]